MRTGDGARKMVFSVLAEIRRGKRGRRTRRRKEGRECIVGRVYYDSYKSVEVR